MSTTATVTSAANKNTPTANAKSSRGGPRPRRVRAVRRRGRAKDEIDSDDEIEREARSDSESEEESSLVSESDYETESEDDNATTRSEAVTPSTTQSPPPLPSSSKTPSGDASLVNGEAGPFVATTDWAQMVADENAHGAGDLPVIDFKDLDNHSINQPVAPEPRLPKSKPKKSKKALRARVEADPSQAVTSAAEAPRVDGQPTPQADTADQVAASVSRPPSRERKSFRPRGLAVRQAYQERLESDPSYVPKIGGFWGHDDRLLDKDLRPMSSWWRDKRGRGRGRGAFLIRGQGGRGGFVGRQAAQDADTREGPEDIPPIDRPWTHDGFEEMRRREERRQDERRRLEAQQNQNGAESNQSDTPHPRLGSPAQRGPHMRGRGGYFGSRGRGGSNRGGSPATSRPFFPPPDRVWYAMKPEKPWTQQHDYSLHLDPALKPRPGQGPGIRIKLPGREARVVRAPPKSYHASKPSTAGTDVLSVIASESSDKVITVRIPPRPGPVKDNEPLPPSAEPEPITTVPAEPLETSDELPIEEVFRVRPQAVPQHIPIQPSAPKAKSPDPSTAPPVTLPLRARPPHMKSPLSKPVSFLPEPEVQQKLETILVQPPIDPPGLAAQIEETVLRKPSSSNVSASTSDVQAPTPQSASSESRPAPPTLHPIQTSFSPVPQSSPPFGGSPYTYGPAPALPPGVAMSQHGYPYEVATGRPVYIQTTPAPMMYTPRPMMHAHHMSHGSVPFVPGHMHHHSSISSPDFLASSHTPVNGFMDPQTGVPIFTPPRQSSRIEIRAPDQRSDGRSAPKPSGLRTTVTEITPQTETHEEQYYAQPSDTSGEETSEPVDQSSSDDTHQPSAAGSGMMQYNPYQQQYYYPEQYGYPPYMDVSQHIMPYEMYPPPSHHDHPQNAQPQPIIYY
ncbi:hypothetical protein K474DRAFT_1655080 [Panus rudis PR-1116 ss-1]|nr:hypothetical protein K474DRAFT_1655080 [Panus rudis PR-1116 ss-1]